MLGYPQQATDESVRSWWRRKRTFGGQFLQAIQVLSNERHIYSPVHLGVRSHTLKVERVSACFWSSEPDAAASATHDLFLLYSLLEMGEERGD